MKKEYKTYNDNFRNFLTENSKKIEHNVSGLNAALVET